MRRLIVGGAGYIGSGLKLDGDVIDLKNGADFLELPVQSYDQIIFLAVHMERSHTAYRYNEDLYKKLLEYQAVSPHVHVIYTSSAAVYRDSTDLHDEVEIPEPANWYGKSKQLGEIYVQRFPNHSILRLSNVFGEAGNGVIDKFFAGERRIFGDGRQIRDYVPVGTVRRAIEAAAQNPGKMYGITNISSGIGQDTYTIYKKYGKKDGPVYEAAREGDVQCSMLDNSRMRRLFDD